MLFLHLFLGLIAFFAVVGLILPSKYGVVRGWSRRMMIGNRFDKGLANLTRTVEAVD